ncbi:MAG TPA: hypothetical protein PKA90_10340, partial [Ignavibacteria bacterium]|nr:hypothetical protein [Ignavibacteria bacterium]HMR40816.1 hypothetical protein [Ignavibacteria bacterium]
METTDIKNIWKSHDNLLERSMRLNILCIETIQSQKSKSELKPLLFLRIFEAAVHIVIALFLGSFLKDVFSNINIAILLGAVLLFVIYSLILCIRQIAIIIQINYSESVTDIQQKLSVLQTHVLDYFKLVFLVIPFWFVYPILGLYLFASTDIMSALPSAWWTGNIIVSIIFIFFSIYAYTQISYKNINKRWVRFFIKNAGGKSVEKAMEFLNVIEEFKDE